MIHRSFVSVVLVVTFVSAVSFRSFRWFRFDGFVLAFWVLVHARLALLDYWIVGLLDCWPFIRQIAIVSVFARKFCR